MVVYARKGYGVKSQGISYYLLSEGNKNSLKEWGGLEYQTYKCGSISAVSFVWPIFPFQRDPNNFINPILPVLWFVFFCLGNFMFAIFIVLLTIYVICCEMQCLSTFRRMFSTRALHG